MLNQILNTIFMTSIGTVEGMCLEYMLEPKDKNGRFLRILFWSFSTLVSSLLNVFTGVDTMLLRALIHWGIILVGMFAFYKDVIWKRLLAIILMYMGGTSPDLLMMFILQFIDIDVTVFFDRTTSLTTIMVGFATIGGIICLFIIASVWKQLMNKGNKLRYFWFFIVYIMNYAVSVVIMETEILKNNITNFKVFPVFSALILEIAILSIVFSQSEKENMEENLLAEKRQSELEKMHYEEVEKHRKEISLISEKNKKEVCHIKDLLEKQNPKAAEERLHGLLKWVESTKEKMYCNIPIVNALLSEKDKICKEHEIKLIADIQIPVDIKMQKIDICSVFGNLLDNAIRASLQYKTNKDEPEIYLTAGAKGDYLIIKCKNSSMKPGDKPDGTGYGLKILKEIALKYQGEFHAEYHEQIFEAQMILKYT